MVTKVNPRMIDGAPINILDFGADPTGTTDSTQAIKDAVAAASNKIVVAPEGDFLISDEIDLSNCRGLVGQGSAVTRFLVQGALNNAFTYGLDEAWLDEIGTLTADVSEIGERSFDISNTSGVNQSDQIIIWDSLEYSWNGARANYYKGEMVKVDSVVGNTINSVGSLYDAYTAAATTKIYKHNGKPFQVKGISVISDLAYVQSFGVRISGVIGLDVDDLKMNSFYYTALGISRCRYVNITNCDIDMTQRPADAGTNYSLSVGNSQDVTISGCYMQSVRHAIAHGGGADPASIVVRNSVATNCTLVCTTSVGAVDIHGGCENVVYRGNTIDGGCTLSGHRCSYIDNVIRNANGASAIKFAEPISLEHTISGNIAQLHYAASDRGHFFDAGGNTSDWDVNVVRAGVLRITDNQITSNAYQGNTEFSIITLRNRGSVNTRSDIVITGNTIDGGAGASSLVRGVYLNNVSGDPAESINISNNTLLGCIIQLTGASAGVMTISDNYVDGRFDTNELQYGIYAYADGGNLRVANNTVKNITLSGIYCVGQNAVRADVVNNTVQEYCRSTASSTHRAGIILQDLQYVMLDGNRIYTSQPDAAYGIRTIGTIAELVNGLNDVIVNGTRVHNISNPASITTLTPLQLDVVIVSAPPTFAPTKLGQLVIDSAADEAYIAVATPAAASSWKLVGT